MVEETSDVVRSIRDSHDFKTDIIGFVAEFLHKAGYEVVFVDVMDSIIEQLQKTKSYTVTEIGADGEHSSTIDNYRAINSKHNEAQVIDEIATADIVTCAVGPNILKFIAPVIAKGINKRTKDSWMAVIACENAIKATDTLRGHIDGTLDEDARKNIKSRARFANSAVDRIVPGQDADAGLNVKIEKFYEWCVDKTSFEGQEPNIPAVHWVDDLTLYIERKLFTVNTAHATAAYYGHNRGIKYVHEVLADKELHEIVQDTLKETAHLCVTKHGIDRVEQDEYVQKIVKRISNPILADVVERVGRAPMRKLSRNERFIGPASHLAESGDSYQHLLGGIEMALRFQNVEGDDESKELATILKTKSAEDATKLLTGLEVSHPLFKDVVAVVQKVQKS